MKINLTKFAALCACLMCFAFSADAQKSRPTRKRTVNSATAAPKTANNVEVKQGAEKVSIQIKNLSRFVFNLGSVARVIEDLDRDIAARKASRNAAALNDKNKQAVVTTLKNIHAGIVALEIEFRTKPALKNYLFNIQGISDMAGLAEDQAADGQVTESGKTILMIIEKLSDTLAALP